MNRADGNPEMSGPRGPEDGRGTPYADHLESTLRAVEAILRPGPGRASSTVAHHVVVRFMKQDGIELSSGTGVSDGEQVG